MLTDWFAQKNLDDTVIFTTIFITFTNQVCLITDNNIPLQSGGVFYERAKLTGAHYKHMHEARSVPFRQVFYLREDNLV